ncbi:MAG: hypothetical protein K2K42_06965, partial [Eubacterium sp.]|nr:hypothetical protein [Eubacterium sp.]
ETLKESFSSKKGLEDYTIKEYADIVKKENENNLKSLKQKDDLAYFEYSNSNKYYITALYKTNEAFWTVTFSCKDKYQEEYNKTFIDFAKEIKFTN